MRPDRPVHVRMLAALGFVCALAGTATAGTAASSGNIVAEAKARLAALATPSNGKGLPTSTPRWKPGEKVWVIACNLTTGCLLPGQSLQQAGKKLGWQVTIFDGKGNPSEYANGVEQAIAAKANAIVLDSVDCDFVKAPLEQAKKAGIVVYGYDAMDCSDPREGGGPSLIDGNGAGRGYAPGTDSLKRFMLDWGKDKVDYVIAKTNGHANVITFTESDIVSMTYQHDAIVKELARCPGCKVVANVDLTLQDYTDNGLLKKFQTALAQHPEANAVITLYDLNILAAVAPALQQAGRSNMLVAGGEGWPDSLARIREGKGQSCAFAFDVADVGYPMTDNLIRLFDHQPAIDEGVGILLIDRQHNLNRIGTAYHGFFPYATYYAKLWRAAER
jgi:ribose transport system substrate-binding protein